jgi:hypothetical protein
MTRAGIEPATLRCVVQHINHCATANPTYRVQHVLYMCNFWFYKKFVWIPVHGVLKTNLKKLYSDHKETRLYLQLGASRKWQNVQQFLKLSSTMFSVHLIINEFFFPRNVSIILIKHPYYTWHCNYLTSSLLYFKSCCQHNLTVLLHEEYHHQYQHI